MLLDVSPYNVKLVGMLIMNCNTPVHIWPVLHSLSFFHLIVFLSTVAILRD